jgi:hypothetical protein
MKRFLVIPLLFVLSGVPAASIVCDLLLCTESATAGAAHAGCHDHASSELGSRITARGDACTHLSVADPSLASGRRPAPQSVRSTAARASISETPLIALHFEHRQLARAPSRASFVTSFVPLRI